METIHFETSDQLRCVQEGQCDTKKYMSLDGEKVEDHTDVCVFVFKKFTIQVLLYSPDLDK